QMLGNSFIRRSTARLYCPTVYVLRSAVPGPEASPSASKASMVADMGGKITPRARLRRRPVPRQAPSRSPRFRAPRSGVPPARPRWEAVGAGRRGAARRWQASPGASPATITSSIRLVGFYRFEGKSCDYYLSEPVKTGLYPKFQVRRAHARRQLSRILRDAG